MSFLIVFLILLAGRALTARADSKCDASPIYVDIHKREVNGTNEFVYGSFIGVGNPHQNQSLWPSIVHNETYFTADDFCDGIDPALCNATITGGTIVVADDTTFNRVEGYRSTDFATNLTSMLLTSSDTVHLYEHYFESDAAWETEVANTPVIMLQNGTFNSTINDPDHPGGLVGLGPQSTLLQNLYEINLTASKSYSLYIGTGYPRAGGDINGSLTFGGYDSSRFTGNVSTFDFAQNTVDGNPFQVGVQQITLSGLDVGGSTISVNLLDSANFTAALTTEQYGLTLPLPIQERFITLLHATPSNTTDTLDIPNLFTGDLTIHLTTNLSITIPSSAFSNLTTSSTYSTPISTLPSASNTTATFGAAFLSYAYLMVSQHPPSPQFHLAPAVLEAPFITTTTWCPGTTPQPYEALVHKPSFAARTGLAGAIVGGVIGGTAIAILIFALLRNYLRHCRSVSNNHDGFVEMGRKQRPMKKMVHFLPLTHRLKSGAVQVLEPETPGLQVFGTSAPVAAGQADRKAGGGEAEWYFEPPPRDPRLDRDKARGKGKRGGSEGGSGSGGGNGSFTVVGRFGKRMDGSVSVTEVGR